MKKPNKSLTWKKYSPQFLKKHGITKADLDKERSRQEPNKKVVRRVCYELWQDGIMVASVDAPINEAKREIEHYKIIYGQDGPCEIREEPTVIRQVHRRVRRNK